MQRVAWYAFFGLLIVGSFVGLWHALPLLTVIADEEMFVGSVLRAMQHHTIVPFYMDVPYGTLTYLGSYLLHIPLLAILLVLNHGSVSALIVYMQLHPHIAYLVARTLSALSIIAFTFWYERLLRHDGVPLVQRLAVVSIPTMTLLPVAVFHTAKVWSLSTVLMATSVFLLYRALSCYGDGEERDATEAGHWSIFSAAAAFANFPLAGIFLINIPILWFTFRKKSSLARGIAMATVYAGVMLLAVFALNFRNIISQVTDVFTHYHPILGAASNAGVHISTFASLILHTRELTALYPLVITLICIGLIFGTVRNRLLWNISLGYAALFFVTIVFLVTWSSDEMAYLRYLLPLAFFFSGMVASLSFGRLRYLLLAFVGLQCSIYIFALYLISMPTTLNMAYDDIVSAYGHNAHVMIYDNIVELDLPKNTATSLTTLDAFCSSRCEHYKTNDNPLFAPLVVGFPTNWQAVHPESYDTYAWISDHALVNTCAGKLAQIWGSNGSDDSYLEIDHGFGYYFNPEMWKLSPLGKNAYVYSVSKSCMDELRQAAATSASVI